MKLRSLILAIALLVPSVAMADPITVAGASWSSTSGIPSGNPAVSQLELASFWSGHSWDGFHRGISYLLEEQASRDSSTSTTAPGTIRRSDSATTTS